MTGNEYQQDALRTVSDRERDDLLTEGVLGLSGETGEVSDIVKKYKYQGHALNEKGLAKELGDIAWYLAITAHAIGYSLDEILLMNMDKRRKRYPEGFAKERSLNREEDDE